MPSPASAPMLRALELAAQALHRSSPNPRVGCVLLGPDGQTIGEGSTQMAGGAHAEIMALRDAAARGHSTQGASAYVTLEPCAHTGRTGPCADALLAAGVRRVVASLPDPNPLVAGQGFARLRAGGVEVQVGDGAQPAWDMNLGFFSRLLRGRPWVRAKVATSLDGITALADGQSQWITAPAARADGHAWRARACAVLCGSGTVLADNPQLNVRACPTPRQPHLVLVDSQLHTPPGAALFAVPGRAVHIYTTRSALATARAPALHACGAQLHCVQEGERVDLPAMLADLAQRLPCNEVHVEAGARLNGTLQNAGLIDEWLAYIAPKLLWQGAGWAKTPALEKLADAPAWHWQSVQTVGADLRLVLRRVWGMPPELASWTT